MIAASVTVAAMSQGYGVVFKVALAMGAVMSAAVIGPSPSARPRFPTVS